jgi:rRNA maturation protein Nop10
MWQTCVTYVHKYTCTCTQIYMYMYTNIHVHTGICASTQPLGFFWIFFQKKIENDTNTCIQASVQALKHWGTLEKCGTETKGLHPSHLFLFSPHLSFFFKKKMHRHRPWHWGTLQKCGTTTKDQHPSHLSLRHRNQSTISHSNVSLNPKP